MIDFLFSEFGGVPVWLILSGVGVVALIMVIMELFDDYTGTYS